MESLIVQMVFSLSAVLVIMAAVTFVVKRYMGIQTPARRTAVKIDILAQKMLQPKRSLFVVRIADTVFVVGSSEQGLQMFTELNDPALLRTIDEQPQTETYSDRIVLNAHNLISRLTGSKRSLSKTETGTR